MSSRHCAIKGQLFASPGVVVRKSVIMKQPRYPVGDFADSSSVVINSPLPSGEDTGIMDLYQ